MGQPSGGSCHSWTSSRLITFHVWQQQRCPKGLLSFLLLVLLMTSPRLQAASFPVHSWCRDVEFSKCSQCGYATQWSINYTSLTRARRSYLPALKRTDLHVGAFTKEKHKLGLSYCVTNLVCPKFFLLLLCHHCIAKGLVGQPALGSPVWRLSWLSPWWSP